MLETSDLKAIGIKVRGKRGKKTGPWRCQVSREGRNRGSWRSIKAESSDRPPLLTAPTAIPEDKGTVLKRRGDTGVGTSGKRFLSQG